MIKLSKFLSVDMKHKYIYMMKRFIDDFSWSYADLKKYDPTIIQHTIPIKENEKLFKNKLRRINPLLMPLIEKEIKKLFDAKIIFPIGFSKWLANLVPIRKNSVEIRIYIDFRNLNKASLKDNYPLPKVDQFCRTLLVPKGCLCWMVFQDTIRYMCIQKIRRKLPLPHDGAHSCMPRCPLV